MALTGYMASRAQEPALPTFGVAIPCHNEAQNIGALLKAIAGGFPPGAAPARIVVFSSASSDGTDEIVSRFVRHSPIPVVLRQEARRSGKAAAVNQLIREMTGLEAIILVSGDVLPRPQCLEKLLAALSAPDVGVAGGRPVPEGPEDRLAVRCSKLLWDMHHVIAAQFPKTTEVTVFRNLGVQIPEDTLCDEAELECALTRLGYRVVYVPDALIRTQSPLTLRDYVSRRFSVTVGHMRLARMRQYALGTLRTRERLHALSVVWHEDAASLSTILLAGLLELGIYVAAWLTVVLGVNTEPRWTISRSSKRAFE